jgi:hypothetical protein
LAATTPRANPLINCHRQRAWTGSYSQQPDLTFHIEACSNDGNPIYLEVFAPWSTSPIVQIQEDESSKVEQVEERGKILFIVLTSIFWSAILGAALLARRNLRLGRGDRHGALRITLFLFVITVSRSVLSSHHSMSVRETSILLGALKDGIFLAVLTWIFYIALEPFARRIWPDTLISWNRLLDGRLRNARIGRDILIGAAIGQFTLVARKLFILIPLWRGEPYVMNPGGSLSAISNVTAWLEEILYSVSSTVFAPLVLFSILILFRLFIRRTWLVGALVASIPITLVGFTAFPLMGAIAPFLVAMIWVPLIYAAVRFGFVALIAHGLWSSIDSFVLLLNPDSWHFTYDLATLVLYLGLAVFAAWTSLGGRKVVQLDLLEE